MFRKRHCCGINAEDKKEIIDAIKKDLPNIGAMIEKFHPKIEEKCC